MTPREAWRRAMRTLECGVAEQNLDGCAYGVALEGAWGGWLITGHEGVASMQLDGFSVEEITAVEREGRR